VLELRQAEMLVVVADAAKFTEAVAFLVLNTKELHAPFGCGADIAGQYRLLIGQYEIGLRSFFCAREDRTSICLQ